VNVAPAVLLCLVLVLALTEVPLRNHRLLDAFFVLHLLLFAFLTQATRVECAPGGELVGATAPEAPPAA